MFCRYFEACFACSTPYFSRSVSAHYPSAQSRGLSGSRLSIGVKAVCFTHPLHNILVSARYTALRPPKRQAFVCRQVCTALWRDFTLDIHVTFVFTYTKHTYQAKPHNFCFNEVLLLAFLSLTETLRQPHRLTFLSTVGEVLWSYAFLHKNGGGGGGGGGQQRYLSGQVH